MHRDDQPFYIKSYVDKDSILYQDSPINSLKIFKASFHANSILVLSVTPVSGHCQVMVFSHTHTHFKGSRENVKYLKVTREHGTGWLRD